MIEIKGLCKTFDKGRGRALEALNLHIPQGSLLGLIGPDGSGKSTLIKVLNTTLRATCGEISIDGRDITQSIREIRRKIGYVPEQFNLYPDLTVDETLRFCGKMYDVAYDLAKDRCSDLYRQLEPYLRKPVGKLSGGTRQKLSLCCALLHQPSILLLDEPTRGLDYPSRLELWGLLQHQQTQGVTIIVATADMNEAVFCNSIVLFNSGRAIATGSPEAMITNFEGELYTVSCRTPFVLADFLKSIPEVRSAHVFGNRVHFVLMHGDIAFIKSFLAFQEDFKGLVVLPQKVSMEDYYLQMMEHA